MGDISKHFFASEFFCKCCHRGAPSQTLLRTLEGIRALYGRPITINSGYRCPRHNAEVGGVTPSEHSGPGEITDAADLACSFSRDRYDLLRIALTLKVNRIGIGRTFIHIGVSPVFPQGAIWLYGE